MTRMTAQGMRPQEARRPTRTRKATSGTSQKLKKSLRRARMKTRRPQRTQRRRLKKKMRLRMTRRKRLKKMKRPQKMKKKLNTVNKPIMARVEEAQSKWEKSTSTSKERPTQQIFCLILEATTPTSVRTLQENVE